MGAQVRAEESDQLFLTKFRLVWLYVHTSHFEPERSREVVVKDRQDITFCTVVGCVDLVI